MSLPNVKAKLNDGTEYDCIRVSGSPWQTPLPSLLAHFNCCEDDLGTHETFDDEENCTEVITFQNEIVGEFVSY